MHLPKRKSMILFGALLLYSFLILFFCTKSSPLYVLNDWYDANTYFTMGKGLMNGAVPYRDLFDDKGPLLYLIYGIGYLMDRTGFLGIFVLQVVSMTLTLLFSFKIARVYTNTDKSALFIAMLAPLFPLSMGIYTVNADLGGGGPEEFMLPIFAIGLYTIIKLIKTKAEDRVDGLLIKSMFLLGILTGCLFFLKFTYIVFCVGLVLPFLVATLYKNRKAFFISLLFLFLGFAVLVLPYVCYAAVTHSGSEFIDVYFTYNRIYASVPGSSLINSFSGGFSKAMTFLSGHVLITVLILWGLLYFTFIEKEHIAISLALILSFLFTITLCSIVPFSYVYIPIAFYCVFGYIAIYRAGLPFAAHYTSSKPGNPKLLSTLAVVLIFMFTVGNNELIAKPLNRLNFNPSLVSCQKQIADIIEADSPQNRTLLEVDAHDGGFYTVAGIVPLSKYFYLLNVSYSAYPAILNGQLKDVQSSLNAYVIAPFKAQHNKNADTQPSNDNTIVGKIGNAIYKNYKLVAVINGTYLQAGETFYLYKADNRT